MSEEDKSHELLLIWMELQRALTNFTRVRGVAHNSIAPWDCDDQNVRDAWNKLTHPDNLSHLQNWLQAELANGRAGAWTEEGIAFCQRRILND